ncbi:MAG: YciI family protein [Xanthobacteraceae bacterium]|nr:YciI family protein [Xanthobacteraceae bacterium]
MQYLLLIYQNEAEMAARAKSEADAMHGEYAAFTQGIIQSGHFKGGERLQPSTTATTVRVRGGKVSTTDGPFAETREQLAGYYMVEAKDLDEASAIAAKLPGSKYGSVEVRPVWPMS